MWEHRRGLKFPPNPDVRDLMLLQDEKIRGFLIDHPPLDWFDLSAHHVQQGGLPRSVWSNHKTQLPFIHQEIERAEREEAFEADGDPFNVENRFGPVRPSVHSASYSASIA